MPHCLWCATKMMELFSFCIRARLSASTRGGKVTKLAEVDLCREHKPPVPGLVLGVFCLFSGVLCTKCEVPLHFSKS